MGKEAQSSKFKVHEKPSAAKPQPTSRSRLNAEDTEVRAEGAENQLFLRVPLRKTLPASVLKPEVQRFFAAREDFTRWLERFDPRSEVEAAFAPGGTGFEFIFQPPMWPQEAQQKTLNFELSAPAIIIG